MAEPGYPGQRVLGFFFGLFLGGILAFLIGYVQWALTARGEDSEMGMLGVYAMAAFGAFSGSVIGLLFSGPWSTNQPKRRLAFAAVLTPVLFFGAMQIVFRGFMYPSDTPAAVVFWVIAVAAIGALAAKVVAPAGRPASFKR